MLLTRAINGPAGFQWTGLGASAAQSLPPTHQLPSTPTTGAGSTASPYDPPPTGYVRGEVFYQTQQIKMQLAAQVARVAAEIKTLYAAGQIQSCWNPALAVDTKWKRNELGYRTHLASVGGPGSVCQFWGLNPTRAERNMIVPGQDLLNQIGMISGDVTLGLPVTLSELRAGNPTLPNEPTIERSYIPTQDQRWIVGRMVYVKSQIDLARLYYDVDLSERTNLDDLLADNTDANGLPGLLTRTRNIGQGRAVGPDMSIKQFIGVFKLPDGQPLFTTHLDNFAMNPITPTTEELNGPQGMYRYYKRGGFLLSKDAAFGKVPLINSNLDVNLSVCMADKCKLTSWCNPQGQCGQISAPQPAAIQQIIEGHGYGWITFVTITPTEYIIRVQAKESTASLATKLVSAISSFVMKLGEWLCQIAPMAASYSTGVIQKETCSYPDATLCAKGEKKGAWTCKCVPPTDGQIVAANVAAQATAKVCGHFQPTPGSPVVPTPPPTVTNYWPWIIGGGLLVGAFLVMRK